MSIISAFRFYADPRIAVVSRIEDFALLKTEPDVLGVTMPNPVVMPTDPAEIEAVMAALKPLEDMDRLFLKKSDLARDFVPACIRDTGQLMYEAVNYSGLRIGTTFSIRPNSDSPRLPHIHHPVAMADIFGSTTVGYLGTRKERPYGRYDFLRHHITVIKDLWHAAGDVQPGAPRLNVILG